MLIELGLQYVTYRSISHRLRPLLDSVGTVGGAPMDKRPVVLQHRSATLPLTGLWLTATAPQLPLIRLRPPAHRPCMGLTAHHVSQVPKERQGRGSLPSLLPAGSRWPRSAAMFITMGKYRPGRWTSMDAGPGSARQREVLVILLPGKRSHPPRWIGEREWPYPGPPNTRSRGGGDRRPLLSQGTKDRPGSQEVATP